MTMKTVLCPVDRSELSRRAFEYAIAFARWQRASLQVFEAVDAGLPPVGGGMQRVYEIPAEVLADVRTQLAEFAAPAIAAGVATDVAVEAGNTVQQILLRAKAGSADLIVLGTHGRSGVERLALGSVAEKILRKAACPVLTVPPAAPPPPTRSAAPFTRVLCATDFSDPSLDAVRYATCLAQEAGAALVLAHVVEWPFGHTTGPDSVTDLRNSIVAELRDRLTRLLPAGAAPDDAVVIVGRPKRDLLELARARGADLIVMGVAGRGALDLALLGSTTHYVIREAKCPVLTVRPVGR
jgi:nucleotide-binding universal stress UspA family protein